MWRPFLWLPSRMTSAMPLSECSIFKHQSFAAIWNASCVKHSVDAYIAEASMRPVWQQ